MPFTRPPILLMTLGLCANVLGWLFVFTAGLSWLLKLQHSATTPMALPVVISLVAAGLLTLGWWLKKRGMALAGEER
jgi:Na+/H+ antiporter NhaB